MRQARIKVPPSESAAFYHCISRSVNGEWLFDDVAKEILRRQLWQVADYCGVKIVTYTIMSNHFHVLLQVPQHEAVPDEEMLRRFNVLYPRPSAYSAARIEVIKSELARNGPEAARWRRRQLALMGDVSQFMKLLKQRFSIWYNKSHRRFGTLWAERFKSVLVEGRENVLQTIAAYIDLNCVRAGLVSDPKEYRFCAYAEAVAGNTAAQDGIRATVGWIAWSEVQASYRQVLFGHGIGPREDAASIPPAHYDDVLAQGGKLPLSALLRCRLRYFTDGAILGSRAFVDVQKTKYRRLTERSGHTQPRLIPALFASEELATLRGWRNRNLA